VILLSSKRSASASYGSRLGSADILILNIQHTNSSVSCRVLQLWGNEVNLLPAAEHSESVQSVATSCSQSYRKRFLAPDETFYTSVATNTADTAASSVIHQIELH